MRRCWWGLTHATSVVVVVVVAAVDIGGVCQIVESGLPPTMRGICVTAVRRHLGVGGHLSVTSWWRSVFFVRVLMRGLGGTKNMIVHVRHFHSTVLLTSIDVGY